MKNKCIFNAESECTNCNECDICDLDKSKICDNCGRCLNNKEQTQVNSIEIDQIFDETSTEDEIDLEFGENPNRLSSEDEEQDDWILIDDIPGLKEMLEEGNGPSGLLEEFPGLMVFKRED